MTPPPLPAAAAVQPLSVAPAGSQPIAMGSVVFRIATGTVIGGNYQIGRSKLVSEARWTFNPGRTREFDIAIIDRLRQLGYTVVDPSQSAFETVEPAKAKYQLGAIVSRVKRDYFFRYTSSLSVVPDEGYGVADIDVEFQVLDQTSSQIVFRKSYTGYGTEVGKQAQPVIPAFMNALDHALADPAFVDVVRVGGSASPGTAPATQLTGLRIPACPAGEALSLPAGTSRISTSVVALRIGGIVGSGVIVSPDGHILTAAHLVKGSGGIIAALPTGMEFDAELLRVDVNLDLAVLKLPGRGYSCLGVARSPTLKVGEDVFVVGSPLGKTLVNSVSRGVLSGDREIDGVRYLQTDATMNPGNSGGPLLDGQGKVQAIVTNKLVGRGLEGLGFGVPIEAFTKKMAVTFD